MADRDSFELPRYAIARAIRSLSDCGKTLDSVLYTGSKESSSPPFVVEEASPVSSLDLLVVTLHMFPCLSLSFFCRSSISFWANESFGRHLTPALLAVR